MHNADALLKYVAENESELKYALKKNITYEPELFEDVWSMAIVKVYNSIKERDLVVKDFKKYFFMSAKFIYINEQNRLRKERNILVNLDDINENEFAFESEEERDYAKELEDLKCRLRESFGETRTRLYFDYKQGKISGGTSFKEIAEENDISIDFVRSTIRDIERFLADSDEDKYYRKNVLF